MHNAYTLDLILWFCYISVALVSLLLKYSHKNHIAVFLKILEALKPA